MNITIIGGGNIGTLMAAEFAALDHRVTVFTPRCNEWSHRLTVYDSGMEILLQSEIACITDEISLAVRNAEWIWITVPAFLFGDMERLLLPHVQPGQKLAVVPGSGGAEFSFQSLVKRGCTLVGLQRVHSIARLEEYGHSVHMLGRKKALHVGTVPSNASVEMSTVIEELFHIPTEALPNYLCVTLTPSNPILHTTRLYGMFRNYKDGCLYPRNYLFYEEWDDLSSIELFACDRELQNICKCLDKLDLTSVVSLPVYYESETIEQLTKKISGIPAFRGITSPMKRLDNGWVPDFQSRYFRADFPFGLKIILDIGKLAGVSVPNIEKIWNWYLGVQTAEDRKEFHCLVNNLEDFYAVYNGTESTI